MAITLNEFRNLPEQIGTDPIADDGAALHSRILHDAPRNLNNLGTKVEKCYSFAFSASHGLEYGGKANPWYIRYDTSFPAEGLAFLWQAPIILPHQAKRLLWTHSIERGNVGGEVLAQVRITGIKLYLSANPLQIPLINHPTTAPHNHESVGVLREDVDVSRSAAAAFITHEVATPSFEGPVYHRLVEDVTTGWENFMRGGHVSQSFGAPQSVLIVCARFDGAAVGDYIQAREWANWGEFE